MKQAEVRKELGEIARIGQMFVEGDLCRRIWMKHSENFKCGDDMDYNPKACVPLKKTLMRLERLCPFPCSTTLWRRRPDSPDRGEAILFGMHPAPTGGDKPPMRYVAPELTPELRTVFLQGKNAWMVDRRTRTLPTLVERGVKVPVSGTKRPYALAIFVPIKDSMGEIAAALEVFTIAV
jgi:hypothetical protein